MANNNIILPSIPLMKVEDVNIDHDYISVLSTDTVLTIAQKMAEMGIPDAVVIDKQNRVMGALDDYDIISKVIAPEKDINSVKAEDIMFSSPRINLLTNLKTVRSIMEELEVSVLPVSDEKKKLLGVITLMDVLEGLAFAERSILDKILRR